MASWIREWDRILTNELAITHYYKEKQRLSLKLKLLSNVVL
jgi:hypothetical protein